MTYTDSQYESHPNKQRWTHLALIVKDIQKSIAWYEKHTHLELLATNEDQNGFGAWLGDKTQAENPFILVLAQFLEGKDPFAPAQHSALGPFAHIGIEVTEREQIDKIAQAAKKEGHLALGPQQMPAPVGYVCFLKDPDGNTIEFSHDQGVYDAAKKVWGSDAKSN
jgi:catechol 2,3-dioxygenase-like lactoylglutathione lyase family enzyme